MARQKKKFGKTKLLFLSDVQIKALEQLSTISGLSQSEYTGMLIERAFNYLTPWGKTESIREDLTKLEKDIADLQERKKELDKELYLSISVSKSQDELRSQLEANYKQEKERLVRTLSRRIVVGVEARYIMNAAAEFSALLENKWTKDELATQAYIQAKTYTESEIIRIKKEHVVEDDSKC